MVLISAQNMDGSPLWGTCETGAPGAHSEVGLPWLAQAKSCTWRRFCLTLPEDSGWGSQKSKQEDAEGQEKHVYIYILCIYIYIMYIYILYIYIYYVWKQIVYISVYIMYVYLFNYIWYILSFLHIGILCGLSMFQYVSVLACLGFCMFMHCWFGACSCCCPLSFVNKLEPWKWCCHRDYQTVLVVLVLRYRSNSYCSTHQFRVWTGMGQHH